MMKPVSGASLSGTLLVWAVLVCTRLDQVSVTGSDHSQNVTTGSDHPQHVVSGSQTGDSVGSTNFSKVIPAQTQVPSGHVASKQGNMDPVKTGKVPPESGQKINPASGQPAIRVVRLSANGGAETPTKAATDHNPPTTIDNSFHYTHLLLPLVVVLFLALFTAGLVVHYHHKVLVKTGAIQKASGGVSPSTSSQGSDEQKESRGKKRIMSALSQHTPSGIKVRNFLTNISNVDSIQT